MLSSSGPYLGGVGGAATGSGGTSQDVGQSAAPTADLQAGAIDDNADFAAYLSYVQAYTGPTMRPLDVHDRQLLQVLDADGKPVSNAAVTLSAGGYDLIQGRTYPDGRWPIVPAAYRGLAEQRQRAIMPRGRSRRSA